MKYKIICSCGHEIIIDVYGETLKHEKKLLFYRENECPDCLIRSLEKQEFMKSLPSLVGSDKQIRWALQLREKHIDLVNVPRLYRRELPASARTAPLTPKSYGDLHSLHRRRFPCDPRYFMSYARQIFA